MGRRGTAATRGGRARRGGLAAAAGLGLAVAAALSGCSGDAAPRIVGTLERDRIELVAEAFEPIVEIAVRRGQTVRAGDLVLRLDPERSAARVERARAARQRAAARLEELERGPRAERIRAARARLKGADGVLETQRRRLERVEGLFRSGVQSSDSLDRARAAYDEALAERDAARADLDALLEGTRAEEIAQAEAALAEAEAALADARIASARLEVRAPRAGRVDALPYEVGERPRPGAVVAVLLAEGAPYARVYVPEPLRARVAPGVVAEVRVDGVAEPLRGRFRWVSHEAAFTPYFALTERDRSRLAYLAEIELGEARARELPTGLPLEARLEDRRP